MSKFLSPAGRACAAALLGVLVVLAAVSSARATKYGPPQRRDVFSPNRRFVLDVNPHTKTHTVYRTTDRKTPLWSFATSDVWHEPYFLSNDGQVVLRVAWEHVQEDNLPHGDCMWFYGPTGLFKTYSFADICPNPSKTSLVGPGPIGNFWHTWYTNVSQFDTRVTLRTTDRYVYEFDMATGRIVDRDMAIQSRQYMSVWWLVVVVSILTVAVIAGYRWLRWPCRASGRPAVVE